MVNALARAAVCDQREWGGGRGWATQALSEGIIHNVAHGLVPLGRAEFRLPKEVVIYDEGGSHTYRCATAGTEQIPDHLIFIQVFSPRLALPPCAQTDLPVPAVPAKGLMRGTPKGSKSSTLRVTAVSPRTRAVAAMSASSRC